MTEKIWVCDDAPSQRFPAWTRGNVGEVFGEAVSPLTWTVYGRLLLEAGWRDAFCSIGVFTPEEFRPEGEPEILACFGGYCYINMTVTRVMAVRVPGLTVEAMDRSLFGDYPDAPPYRPDPRDVNPERKAAAGRWLESLFTVDPKPLVDALEQQIDEMCANRPALEALSEAALLAYFRSRTRLGRPLFGQHVLDSYGSNVLVSFIAQICAAAGAPELAGKVTAGIGDIDSAEQPLQLWDLSREIRASAIVSAAFDAGAEAALERLRTSSDPQAQRFLLHWQDFVRRWGFSGPSVWEIRSPTWRTHPEIPLRMLDRARQVPDDAAPGTRAAARAAERETAIADISARLAGDAQGQGQFLAGARAAAKYLTARERSKALCARLFDEGRRAMLELGQRLVSRGHLARWEHVLMVTDAEADGFVADPAPWKDTILARASRLEMLRAKEPPFVFEGEAPALSMFKDRSTARADSAPTGMRLTGLGVSPGCHTGRARVITSLDEDTGLEPGEIIVALTTDAAWGPLFLAAGAVVVETGAMISHAAIVARELGIPAAVSVAGATRRIPDGAVVTVDGNTGTVTVH